MKKFLLLVVPLAVAGCALTPGHGSLDPAQSVYALEGAYAAALQGAVAYRHLPRCGVSATRVCHDPAVVARLIAADSRAHDALAGAEGIVRAHGTAEQIAAAIALARTGISDFSGMVPAF